MDDRLLADIAAALQADGDGPFIPMRGPNHYQVRMNLPGGAIVLTGATGARRDWVRDDTARLLDQDPKHATVTRIRPPPQRGGGR